VVDRPEFQRGIRAGGAATAVLLAFLYTVAAPTSDYRARIPFLIASGGVTPLVFTLGAFEIAALLGLVLARAASARAMAGASLVALACALAVFSGGVARILPQFPESSLRLAVFAILALLCLGMLLRERRISKRDSGAVRSSAERPGAGLA